MARKNLNLKLHKFIRDNPDEKSAKSYIENMRWGKKISCPHCMETSVSKVRRRNPMPYRCRKCRKHFSVRTGTSLAKGKFPLDKWLLAISILAKSDAGISGTQLAKKLGVTPKTALRLIERIKEACPDVMGDQSEKAAEGGKKNKRAKKILLAVLCMSEKSDDDWGDKQPQNKKNSVSKDEQGKAATRRDSVRGHRKTKKMI